MLCRISSVRVSPSTRRHLARTQDEGVVNSYVEDEGAARGVEDRRDACGTYAAVHHD